VNGVAQNVVRLKERDAMWTVAVVDPIVVPAVRRLVAVKVVTPNRLTLASLVLGLVSAVAFALGHLVAGALIVQLAFWLDCMDGKLATARGDAAGLGGLFDDIADALRVIANVAGLAIATLGGAAIAPVALVAYLGLRFARIHLEENRADHHVPGHLTVAASSGAVLRVARRRAMPPATTVELELLVLTLGPLVGPAGIAVAAIAGALVEGARYATYAVELIGQARHPS
jgi:phosphatidylglycerophosphate synthase